jgi:hypothetical protein
MKITFSLSKRVYNILERFIPLSNKEAKLLLPESFEDNIKIIQILREAGYGADYRSNPHPCSVNSNINPEDNLRFLSSHDVTIIADQE